MTSAGVAAVVVTLALLLWQAAAPNRLASAHPALVTVADAVLAAPDRVAKRPPAPAPEGDPAMAAHVAAPLGAEPPARPARPIARRAPASSLALRLPPARGPPGAVA
jgi:hypothetical protein